MVWENSTTRSRKKNGKLLMFEQIIAFTLHLSICWVCMWVGGDHLSLLCHGLKEFSPHTSMDKSTIHIHSFLLTVKTFHAI